MGEKQLDRYTIGEYLAFDDQSEGRNEYDNGVIVGMSGGMLNHGIIGNNINTEIAYQLKQRNERYL